ncbi:hypothetical protein D1831_11910 [Lactiplantibacillus garii]|uniref:Uncharacterized protein n=1 Tax=Lactiplantibacillus garii TaxID=2306423 RepID=A0A426D4H5_9LACO|nr:hypothetical protein [Lactiplantibacillus garii]RRK09575.1 hypothetical protein D1831_11910 [Lactiplantibacillus garii]
MTPNETYDALEKWHLLPDAEFTWRPFSSTAVYVETMQARLVYRLDLANATVAIFKADPSTELSEHFLPLKTVPLTTAQLNDLKHRHDTPVMQ